MGIAGVSLVFLGILIIVMKKNCKSEIQGIFIGSVYIKSQYTPIFKYEYKNEWYKKQSLESFSKRRIRSFIKGEKYTIFVNDKKPRLFVIDKKLRYGEILLIGLGFVFVVISLLLNIGVIAL